MAEQTAEQPAPRVLEGYREGSRWIHQRPPGDELAEWFASSVPIHDGMSPGKYVGGVTMIPNKERFEVPVLQPDGQTVKFVEQLRLVWTPYMKVETRVAYFWDLCALRGWRGEIEPAALKRIEREPLVNDNLPPGFFRYPTPNIAGQMIHMIGASFQVRVHERDIRAGVQGHCVMKPPGGTKAVPLLGRHGPDEHALSKAETGAVGRALGMAGMLVIPGSGIATAEDVLELQSRTAATTPAGGEAAELPVAKPETPVAQVDQGERALELIGLLQSDHPELHEQFTAWAKERKINLSAIDDDGKLRSVVHKLEKLLDTAGKT